MGPLLLVGNLVLWVLLLWAGWTTVFASDPEALALSSNREQAGFLDRVYFAGMALFSLGTGDVVATTPLWRLVSVLATATGLFLVTLSLSYFISVMGAATDRRVLAARLQALGDSPQAILTNAWDGGAFSGQLSTALSSLSEPIAEYAEQHITHHVLHYIHTRHSSRSALVGVARLDEALTLLDAVDGAARPDRFLMEQVRSHLTAVLEVVGQSYRHFPDVDPPLVPETASLRAAGIPLVETDELERRVGALDDRRRDMAALVASDGWRWEDV